MSLSMETLLASLDEDEPLDDALPSAHQVPAMSLEGTIAALHSAAAQPGTRAAAILAAACCWRLCVLVQRAGMDRAASSAGALSAIADAMRAHHDSWMMLAAAMECLALTCIDEDDGDPAHPRALAHHANALAMCIGAMLAFADAQPDLLARGCMALGVLVGGDEGQRQRALELGAREEWLQLSL